MSSPSDLSRGAYSGKETKLFYNSGTYASPVWVEMKRARNIQINRGPSLNDVEFHGANATSSIPGYNAFGGSFELVRRRGADPVYDAMVAARDAGGIIHIRQLNGPLATAGSKGFDAPVLLGEGSSTANGGDAVAETFNVGLADAYDINGDVVEVEDVLIAA